MYMHAFVCVNVRVFLHCSHPCCAVHPGKPPAPAPVAVWDFPTSAFAACAIAAGKHHSAAVTGTFYVLLTSLQQHSPMREIRHTLTLSNAGDGYSVRRSAVLDSCE